MDQQIATSVESVFMSWRPQTSRDQQVEKPKNYPADSSTWECNLETRKSHGNNCMKFIMAINDMQQIEPVFITMLNHTS